MSRFKMLEKEALETLFDRGGYVLDFSDRTFSDFFDDYDIDIYDEKYRFNGTSKMKHLRAFWEIESDELVGKILHELLEYALIKEQISPENESYINSTRKIIARLRGENIPQEKGSILKEKNSHQKLSEIDWVKLNIDDPLKEALQQRIEEIHRCLEVGSSLSVIFLCGSTLEGLLQKVAHEHSEKFLNARSAPKNKNDQVKNIDKWALKELIDVAYQVRLIKFDTKRFSHTLWDFRNFIHPQKQVSHDFRPTQRTAKMIWDILQAVIEDLNRSK